MWKSGLAVCSICLLRCFLWGFAIATADGLLPNGNFEEAPAVWAVVGNVIVGADLLPKWKISGLVEYVSSGDEHNQMLVEVPDNGHAVRLGNDGMISQEITGLKKGSFYSLSFSVAKACGKSQKLNVTVSPFSQVLPLTTVYDTNGWDTYAWGFQTVADVHEVVLRNPDQNHEEPNCGPLIDGVALKETVPHLSTVASGDLVVNGDFEVGPHDFLNGTNGVLLLPSDLDHSALPGWTVESRKPCKYIDYPHFRVPKGHRAVELISGRDSVLSQTIKTVAGKSYRLSFAVGDGRNNCKGLMKVKATAGHKTFTAHYESKGAGRFKDAEFTFTAHSPTTRIAFMSLSYIMKSDKSGNMCGPVVDQVQVVAL